MTNEKKLPKPIGQLLTLGLPVLGICVAFSAIVIGVRSLGWLEAGELNIFDRMMQLRPTLKRDSRLIVVKVTEDDIQEQSWPISDAVLNQLVSKLAKHEPAAIGLDIYRDMPNEPGHQEFINTLKENPKVVPVCKVSDQKSKGVAPPPGMEKDRPGFADIVVDGGGIVRRGLLFVETGVSLCPTPYGFSFQLARLYLEKQGIEPELTENNELKFGQTLFKRLSPNAGAYRSLDERGYQILLNYRTSEQIADSLTLGEALKESLDPTWIKDKIVMVGITDSSIDDTFYTPYSASQTVNQTMPGVVVHAQLTSQIIDAALGERPLFWFLSEWQEILWIVGWSLAGGATITLIRHPLYVIIASSSILIVLFGSSWVIFLQAGWVPIVAPSLSFLLSCAATAVYLAYRVHEERQNVAALVETQNEDIALLKSLLQEKTYTEPLTVARSTNLTTENPLEEGDDETEFSTEALSWDSSFRYRSVGHYQITKVIASGGFGSTYLAQDTRQENAPQCVIKHLQPAVRDKRFLTVARRLFQTEAEILGKLGKHPQIPELFDSFEEDEEFYLVEQYIPGETLHQELIPDQRMDEARVVQILKDILTVLDYLQKHGVIHRDIKPSNIISSQTTNQLVLIDFGAVKEIKIQDQIHEHNLTVAIGTKGYAPPEQYAGQPNFSSDIYALGIIGIQAMTGIAPNQLEVDDFSGNLKWQHLVRVSEGLINIVDKMSRYHFPERYKSAKAVLADLAKL
ncbi:MAG: CHASE2 domain-containing serine/threonine-protein kinase [Spirulinaceae cyanobacterium]